MITLNGDDPSELNKGDVFQDLGAFSDRNEPVSVSGTVNAEVPGTYTLTYTATDTSGNVGTATRDVIVYEEGMSNVKIFCKVSVFANK